MKFGISMGEFLSLTQCAKFAKLGVFWGILSNWVFSAENGILKGPKIVLFIGIVNSDFSESGRHIHVQNLGEKPPPPPGVDKPKF